MLAAVAIALLAAPAAAAAPAQLPVGETDGVRVVQARGGLVVVFTASANRLWRKVAGRRVSVFCTDLPETHSLGGDIVSSGGTTFRAPKRGRRLDTGDVTPGLDYCRVWLAARAVKRHGQRRTISRKLLVTVPLTQRGAVYLDEQHRTFVLMTALTIVGMQADDQGSGSWPTPEAVTRPDAPLATWLEFPVAPLAGPEETPPADTVGYYSDDNQHVAVVIVSAAGRRLFVELDADDVLRTNVSGYMTGDLD